MTDRAPAAVFLSYAREDFEAARRIADALLSHGFEVWFDQGELAGGDVWDQKIRRQIKDCALFIPVVSAHTQERREGYFRLEWKLAAERTHLMAEGVPFIAPVAIDDTRPSPPRWCPRSSCACNGRASPVRASRRNLPGRSSDCSGRRWPM